MIVPNDTLRRIAYACQTETDVAKAGGMPMRYAVVRGTAKTGDREGLACVHDGIEGPGWGRTACSTTTPTTASKQSLLEET